MTPQRRPYQQEAIESINRFFRNGYGNPVVTAPTGAGKSLIIAWYIADAIQQWTDTRIVVLAHVKELIQQNSEAFSKAANTKYGIYSAGLRKRETMEQVTFGQIQSCYKVPNSFGYVDLVIIDECHLVPPRDQGRYREFIEGLRVHNPKLKVIGFTATPYRMNHGWIHKGDDTIFDGIAYDIKIEDLIEQGYLVPPVARGSKVHADLSGVHIRNGEFIEAELQQAFSPITEAAVEDMVQRTIGRKAVLVFCTGVEHAEQTVRCLRGSGEESVKMVTGKTNKADREELVEEVRNGKLRWLVNVGVFTTGFDAPNIDCVVLLRATQSASLMVQCIGRGLRLADGKKDCLVLDYGDNIKRHGPLNDVYVREPGERINRDTVRAKDCPSCEGLVGLAAKVCPMCGYEFPVFDRAITHGTEASEVEILADNTPRWREVLEVQYRKHVKEGRESMRVDYRVGIAEWVSEFVCFGRDGYAGAKAKEWAQRRGYDTMDVDVALIVNWPQPKEVKIVKQSGYWRVKDYKFDEGWLNG